MLKLNKYVEIKKKDGSFGALGHGILDVDTKKLMTIKSGNCVASNITSIHKGEKGIPGELVGELKNSEIIGDIILNTEVGVYGKLNLNKLNKSNKEELEITSKEEVKTGPAKILSNIEGTIIKEYDVYIEDVNAKNNDEKGMIVKITDQNLLSKTNGIVQGMSGSPIIQNNKIVGAITHVFVQNPKKGYGIFIQVMLDNEKASTFSEKMSSNWDSFFLCNWVLYYLNAKN